MAGRVGVDPEAVLLAGERGRAKGQRLGLGLVDVVDHDVQVELLRERRVGPAGRLVVGSELEARRPRPLWRSPMTTQSSSTLVTGRPSSSE